MTKTIEMTVRDPRDPSKTHDFIVNTSFLDASPEEQQSFIGRVVLPGIWARESSEAKESETWKYLKGLGASAARGASLGATDFVPSLKDRAKGFSKDHPIAGITSEVLGAIAPFFATGGASLLGRGVTSAAKLTPVKLLDSALSSVKMLGGNGTLRNSIANAAIGTGIYNANTKEDPSKTYLDNFKSGTSFGGITGLGVAGIGRIVNPIAETAYNLVTKKGTPLKYLESKLKEGGLSLSDFKSKLESLPKNARLHDADQILGFNGLLGKLSKPDKKNYQNVRRGAIEDIKSTVQGTKDVLDSFLGHSVPENWAIRVQDKIRRIRSDQSKKHYNNFLYEEVDLSKNPELFNILTSKSSPDPILKAASENATDALTVSSLNKLGEISKLNSKIKKDKVTDIDSKISDLANLGYPHSFINKSIAKDIISLMPKDLNVRGAALGAYEKAFSNLDNISSQYSSMKTKPISFDQLSSLKLRDLLKRASPNFNQATKTYEYYSRPLNMFDLLKNLTNKEKESSEFLKRLSSLGELENFKKLPTKESRRLVNLLIDKKSKGSNDYDLARVAKQYIADDKSLINKLAGIHKGSDLSKMKKALSDQYNILKSREDMLRPVGLLSNDYALDANLLNIATTPILSPLKMGIKSLNAIIDTMKARGQNKKVIDFLQNHPDKEAIDLLESYLKNDKLYSRFPLSSISNAAKTNLFSQMFSPYNRDNKNY